MKKAILAICLCFNSVCAEELTVSKILNYVTVEGVCVEHQLEKLEISDEASDWLIGFYCGMYAAYTDVEEYIEMAKRKGRLKN